jgi:hypothetical protein
MASIKIAFINQSTVLTDAQVQAAIAPLQIQVSQHFVPVWGVDADLSFVRRDHISPHHQFKPFLSSLALLAPTAWQTNRSAPRGVGAGPLATNQSHPYER